MKDFYVLIRLNVDVNEFDLEKYTGIIIYNEGKVYMVTTNDINNGIRINFKCDSDTVRKVDAALKEDSNVYAHMIVREGE